MIQLHEGKTIEQLLATVVRVQGSAGVSPVATDTVERIESRMDRRPQERGIAAEQVCESCYGTKEITVRGMESDHTEQVDCPDCRRKK